MQVIGPDLELGCNVWVGSDRKTPIGVPASASHSLGFLGVGQLASYALLSYANRRQCSSQEQRSMEQGGLL